MCIVENMEGSLEPFVTCAAMDSSVRWSTKSAFQYHCIPGVNSPSNRLCSAGNGTGPTPTSSGVAQLSAGLSNSAVRSGLAVEHQTTPQTVRMCSDTGNMSTGVTTRNAKNPLMSSGAVVMNRSYAFMTAGASSTA